MEGVVEKVVLHGRYVWEEEMIFYSSTASCFATWYAENWL